MRWNADRWACPGTRSERCLRVVSFRPRPSTCLNAKGPSGHRKRTSASTAGFSVPHKNRGERRRCSVVSTVLSASEEGPARAALRKLIRHSARDPRAGLLHGVLHSRVLPPEIASALHSMEATRPAARQEHAEWGPWQRTSLMSLPSPAMRTPVAGLPLLLHRTRRDVPVSGRRCLSPGLLQRWPHSCFSPPCWEGGALPQRAQRKRNAVFSHHPLRTPRHHLLLKCQESQTLTPPRHLFQQGSQRSIKPAPGGPRLGLSRLRYSDLSPHHRLRGRPDIVAWTWGPLRLQPELRSTLRPMAQSALWELWWTAQC